MATALASIRIITADAATPARCRRMNFRCAVAPSIGTRDDRFVALVARDVFGECGHRLIALGGILLERLAENRVEIALARPPQPIARHAAFRQDSRRLGIAIRQPPGPLAEPRWLFVRDGLQHRGIGRIGGRLSGDDPISSW